MAASALDLNQILKLIRDPSSGIGILQPDAAMPEYIGPPLAPGQTSMDVAANMPPPPPTQPMAGPMDFGPPDISGAGPVPALMAGAPPAPADTAGAGLDPLSSPPSALAATPTAAAPPTKLSRLLHFMATIGKGAGQGVADALASGALNAEPGKSSFGAGFQGAQMMPILRAQRKAQMDQMAARAKLEAAQTKQAESVADWRKAQAEAARTKKSTYHTTPRGLEEIGPDGKPVGIVKGTEAMASPEQQAMADLIDNGLTASEAYGEVQKQKQNKTPTAFSVWREQNPNKPVEDFIRLGPEARAQFVTPTYQPTTNAAGEITGKFNTRTGTLQPVENPTGTRKSGAPVSKTLTPNEARQIETNKTNRYEKLHQFKWDDKGKDFYNAKTGDSMSQDEYLQAEQEIEDAYHREIAAGGGIPDTRTVEQVRAAKGETPEGVKPRGASRATPGGRKVIGPTVAEVDSHKAAAPAGRVAVWKDGVWNHVPKEQASQAVAQGFKVFQ